MPGAPYDPKRGWQYSDFPSKEIREQRCQDILFDLGSGHISWLDTSADTRPIHRRMFEGMHPDGHDYFAGHYRGEPLGVLATYNVTIGGATAPVCWGYPFVSKGMEDLAQSIRKIPSGLVGAPGQPASPTQLVRQVQVACAFLVQFLTIHPYADGNGHLGRYLIWALLHGFGLHPRRWPLNERPQDPPYSAYLDEFRSGNRAPLVNFVLTHL